MFSNTKKEIAPTELSNANNIIGKGTSLIGDLNTTGNVRVEGKVEGSIQTKAKLVLGDTSIVEGNIVAQTAEIGGEIQGTITVSGLLILKPTAIVNGDIITSKLVFEEGAKFNGKCSMNNSLKESKEIQPLNTISRRDSSLVEPNQQQISRP